MIKLLLCCPLNRPDRKNWPEGREDFSSDLIVTVSTVEMQGQC